MVATPTNITETPRPADELVRCVVLQRLEAAFRQSFAVVDPARNVLERVTSDWPRVDVFRWLPLCEAVARSGRAEIIEDHAPLMLLAVPLGDETRAPRRVAVAVLTSESNPSYEAVESAARAFGVDPQQLATWVAGRRAWPAYAVETLANALVEAEFARQTASALKSQISDVSAQLLATFEELNLLHQLTERLSLGRTEHDLMERSVEWLGEIVPSECVYATLFGGPTRHAVVAGRDLPIEQDRFNEFFGRLGPQAERRTLVLNRDRTSSPTWAYPEVREVVCAPIIANDDVIGWLAALNYRPKRGVDEDGFGTVEASLLTSVATLVGVHAGNRDLYVQRTELFESAVHALTSAIDAKDPYTCGHSDRVARIAVRLARALGVEGDDLNTIYLGGLLHDIGKIGIDDSVLRKPEKLTDEEYEQIKQHPTLGERILRGVPQLKHVLPIVLHHHESWDGSGYPSGMAAEQTPLLARITAVADSIDAMGSDRPYRKGMPVERIEAILRDGAGSQWDPQVVDAYFEAHEDIEAISRIDREPLSLDVGQWNEGDACLLEIG